jgi:hypothetical protein
MNHRLTKLLIASGATTAAILAAVAAAIAIAPATAAAGRVAAAGVPASTTVSDYWEQTHHGINISTTGGVETPIMSRTLPAGHWVLHADQTMANLGPSDFGGCSIGDTSNHNLNTHRTVVGNPNLAGAKGPSPLSTVLSETAAVSLSASSKITVFCEHDNSNGATPFIDPNADLWAHRSSRLIITQLP